jgi:hypothetical protein
MKISFSYSCESDAQSTGPSAQKKDENTAVFGRITINSRLHFDFHPVGQDS